MPYLQLDLAGRCSPEDKKRLAMAMCETYAQLMSVDIRRISVAIRELGEGGLWRIPEVGGKPEPCLLYTSDAADDVSTV